MEGEMMANALDAVNQSKLADKIYDDLASPPLKKIGLALGTVVDVGNSILWPVKWANERTRIFFENNLKKYEKKLAEIPEDQVTQVPSEISIPILEKFIYVSNKEISDAFVKLLTSASSSETAYLAHPGFVSIINRLSPDEAKILSYFKNKDSLPKLTLSFYNSSDRKTYNTILNNVTGLEKEIELLFAENIDVYFDNLCSLGLIEKTEYIYTKHEKRFADLVLMYNDIILLLQPKDLTPEEAITSEFQEKGMFILSKFGYLFVNACIE